MVESFRGDAQGLAILAVRQCALQSTVSVKVGRSEVGRSFRQRRCRVYFYNAGQHLRSFQVKHTTFVCFLSLITINDMPTRAIGANLRIGSSASGDGLELPCHSSQDESVGASWVKSCCQARERIGNVPHNPSAWRSSVLLLELRMSPVLMQ